MIETLEFTITNIRDILMKNKINFYILSIISCLFLSNSTFANEPEKLSIAVMDNARIFAQFDDDIPAVINYFTSSEEEEIITFYKSIYGEPNSYERLKGILTLRFSSDLYNTRVVISQQNKARQVDILITNIEK